LKILFKVFKKVNDEPETTLESAGFEPSGNSNTGHGIAPCVHLRIGFGQDNWPTLAITSPELSLFKLDDGQSIEVWKNDKSIAIPKGKRVILKKMDSGDELKFKITKDGSSETWRYRVHAIALH